MLTVLEDAGHALLDLSNAHLLDLLLFGNLIIKMLRLLCSVNEPEHDLRLDVVDGGYVSLTQPIFLDQPYHLIELVGSNRTEPSLTTLSGVILFHRHVSIRIFLLGSGFLLAASVEPENVSWEFVAHVIVIVIGRAIGSLNLLGLLCKLLPKLRRQLSVFT